MNLFKVTDIRTGRARNSDAAGIKEIDFVKKIVGIGHIPRNPKNIVVYLRSVDQTYYALPEFKDKMFFDQERGVYCLKEEFSDREIESATSCLGHDRYPYLITREYEAVRHLDEFKGAEVVDDKRIIDDRIITSQIKYTFGLEFETSMGFIPEELCFKNGLVPLRDGSISGTEYSTIVLSNKHGAVFGTELLQQQLLLLRERCYFNKECALHIHMGGFPVEPKAIYILHIIEKKLEDSLYEGILPRLSFQTSRYKKNGKDYCMRLPDFYSFNDLFKYYTAMNYMGSLSQPHPSDTAREQKWRIATRYFGLNLINMLCYSGPKTVEFRFLRPTFNYRKIRLWLLIFNAILQFSERLYRAYGNLSDAEIYKLINRSDVSLITILSIYDDKLRDKILSDCHRLTKVVEMQQINDDFCGQMVDLEEKLFKDII